jgi:hypothetical protein
LKACLLGKAILVLAVIDVALAGLGLILTPTTLTASRQGWLGVAAALAMLAVYGLLGMVGSRSVERSDPRILPIATLFGLVIGGLFVAEMLFEYAILPSSKSNERLGYLEFGSMFLFLFLAGLKGERETGRLWHGVLTAIWSTMIGSLIWVASLLSTYYAFIGTARQEQVLAADQVIEDFKRSGMTDLRAFVLQDYLGGVFFHLLLGLIAAGILGMMGALVAKLLIWQRLVRSANT